jgi:hypothetical protein
VLGTKQPEFINVIEKNDVGVCVLPLKAGAYKEGVKKIMDNYTHYKQQAKLTKEHLNWGVEQLKLVNLYKEVEKNIGAH